MNSNNKLARITGLLYLIIAICGPFSMLYVPSTLVVSGDAGATALNIAESAALFRASLASDSIVFLSEIVLVALLYVLLKEINPTIALAATFARLGMAVIQGINLFNYIFPLLLLSGSGYLAAIAPEQLHAQAMLFLEAHQYGMYVWGLFFALHLPLLGYLVFKSNNFPRIAGILMMAGGGGYLLDSYTNLLQVSNTPTSLLSAILLTAATIGELWFTFWLLLKGSGRNSQATNESGS